MFYILLLRFTLRLSPKKQLLPTVDLLKTFLLVLEKKIGCSGFVGDLEGWRMILIAPETGLQPLFGIPDPLDNSNMQPRWRLIQVDIKPTHPQMGNSQRLKVCPSREAPRRRQLPSPVVHIRAT